MVARRGEVNPPLISSVICSCFLYVCRPGSKDRSNSPSDPNHLCLLIRENAVVSQGQTITQMLAAACFYVLLNSREDKEKMKKLKKLLCYLLS